MRCMALVTIVLPVFAGLIRTTAGQDDNCTLSDLEEFDYMHSPEDGFVIYWKVPAATVSMRVEVDEVAWTGVGFSEDGMMIDSDAVIFLPDVEDGDVGEHILGSQSVTDIERSDYSELSDTGYEQDEDSTYFWFSRNTTPEVPDEEKLVIPNVVGTPIFIIWAHGMDNGFGYHGIGNRGSFEVDLFCPSVPLPTPAPTMAATTIPPIMAATTMATTIPPIMAATTMATTIPPVPQPTMAATTIPPIMAATTMATTTIPPVPQPTMAATTIPPVPQPTAATTTIPPVPQPTTATTTIPPVPQPTLVPLASTPTSLPTSSSRGISMMTPAPSGVSVMPAMGETSAPEGTHEPTMMMNTTPTSSPESMITHIPTAAMSPVMTATPSPTIETTSLPNTPEIEPTPVPAPHSDVIEPTEMPSSEAETPSASEFHFDTEGPTSSPTLGATGFVGGATRVGGGIHTAVITSVAVAAGHGVFGAWRV